MRVRVVALAALAVFGTGCGSTLPQAQQAGAGAALADGGAGLNVPGAPGGAGSAPLPAAGGQVAGPGAALPGSVPAGAGGTSGTGGTGGTGGGPGTSTTGRHSQVESGPVQVGVVYTDNDAASGAGISNGNTFTPRAAAEAAIKAQNARGGLGGRPIKATYAALKSSASDYPTALQAACTSLTQDSHPVVVLALLGFYEPAFTACLAKAGVPLVTGDYAMGDDQQLRTDTGVLAPLALTTDDRARALLRAEVSSRTLTSKDKIGVFYEGCDYNTRTVSRTVLPEATRLGLDVVAQFQADCFTGISGLSALASQASNAVVSFRSKGVTAVTFVSGSVEGNMVLFFATAAQSQQYFPHYALTSAAVPVVQEANTPKQQLANATGLGWLPSIDTTKATPVAATNRCLADLRSQGVTPSSPADRFYGEGACDALQVFLAAASAGGGTSRAAVLAGGAALGTHYASAAAYGGATDFRSGRRTGPARGRLFAWATGCGCFTYSGSDFPLS